ncbi:uncharacterized protein LOC135482749 [Lineus longissimus]|uniref:uncharacterized protein LOC135482749 n=1 Tax=Lineus longissimus TaxID=88925 RepID=UPI002B4DD179
MATVMISRCPCKFSKFPWKSHVRKASNAYYVLLPEIPPDEPETNPVMRLDDFPAFKSINPSNVISGCAKYCIQYETQLGDHFERLKDPKYKKTFSSVLEPIEKITVPLNSTWRTAKHLNYVCGSEGYRQAFELLHPQVDRAKNERWINETLYNSVKEVNADRETLTESQQRLVDMYLLEGRLNGIEIKGSNKKRFVDTLRKLSVERGHFRNKTMLSGNLFSHQIEDFSKLSEFPRHVLNLMAKDKLNPSRGPWVVTLQPTVYNSFLEHCSDRMLRWNVWQAYNNRASVGHNDQNLANHKAINELRTHRRDIANLLGYDNYAQMSMETKMAGNVENVLNMIESLKRVFKPAAEEEIATLQEFAQSEGFTGTLALWDIPYWQRRQREHLHRYEESEIHEYFPLSSVLSGLSAICDKIFGIKIKDCTNEVHLWHQDVKFYKLFNKNGEYLSAFYMDPFLRPSDKISGTWMESGRDRSDVVGTSTFSYLNLNIPPPLPGQQVRLTFREVESLFHEFGHGLQQMLTTVPYSELSGQKNIEWDALQICATFMVNLLREPEIINKLSSHSQTGESIPNELISTVYSSRDHMSAYKMMKQLYISAFDMELYISPDHWHEIMTRTWPEYMPVALSDEDNHPCSLTHIFSDQYPAAYYSFKWSEMIAADIMEEFKEVGFSDVEKVAEKGKRLMESFLTLGGGLPASEVFRKFKGRDPSLDGLIKQFGKSVNGK